MKKNVLALSIAAMIGGFAGVASASVLPGTGRTFTGKTANATTAATMATATAEGLELSDNGKGHMLLVPYYTAQDGNITVLHVVNTDSVNGKALKVRFRGAANSDDVLDFTVFLSPSDVWTGAVSKGADGVATFTSADTSCVIASDTSGQPILGSPAGKVIPFSLERVQSNPNWKDDTLASQTREGYVEILNMADIPTTGNPTLATVGSGQTDLWNAIKHVKGGVPTCDTNGALTRTTQLWTLHNIDGSGFPVQAAATLGGEEDVAARLGLNTPTGGIFGDWYIQNVAKTTTYSGSAPAVIAVDSAGAPARGNYTLFSQVKLPLPEIANYYTADPLLKGTNDALGRMVFDFPDLSTPYTLIAPTVPEAQASLLSTALAVTGVSNQYATDAGIYAQTDWTLSMPTRRYAVAANYKALGSLLDPANFIVVNTGVVDTERSRPFFYPDLPGSLSIVTGYVGTASNLSVDGTGRICVKTAVNALSFFDREEQLASVVSVSPGGSQPPLCGEVSVLSITKDGNGPGVLGASVANLLMKAPFVNGWGTIKAFRDSGNTLSGRLPLMGHAFTKVYNPNVTPGMSGNYGITWAHRFDKN